MLEALEHPPLGGQAILYVQAGALTNVVIAEDGEPLLVRAASAGSESIAQGSPSAPQITHEAAARAHRRAWASTPPHTTAGPRPVTPELEAAVTLQVREGLRRVIAEIQSSRGFYSARPDARPIGGVVLTGAMTTWPGVAELLRDELNIPVLPAGRDNWPDLGTVSVPAGAPRRRGRPRAGRRQTSAPTCARRASAPAGARIEAAPNARVAQVVCGVAALIAAAIVYMVVVSNQVSSRQAAPRRRSATELVQAEKQAAELKPYADFAQATADRRTAVTTVAGARFNWDRTLQPAVAGRARRRLADLGQGARSPRRRRSRAAAADTSGLRAAIPGPALELARLRQARERRAEVHGPAVLDVGRQRGRLQPHRAQAEGRQELCRPPAARHAGRPTRRRASRS